MPRPIIQRNAQYVIHRTGAKSSSPVAAYVWAYSAFRSLMPCTHASSVCVDSSDSRYGTRIENSSELPSGVPRVKRLKEASGPQTVLNVASAAAIFIGCAAYIASPSWSPVSTTPAVETIIAHSPNLSEMRMVSKCWPRERCQADTEMTTPAANMNAPKIVCGNAASATGLVSRAQKSVKLGAVGRLVEGVADGVLHERVGRDDEVRREDAADRDAPDRGEVEFLRELVPAEDPQSDERRLEEEREEPLEGERGAETRRRRSGSSPTSSCRTGTPARCR